jgi:DNA-binding CsgD family transcriptional regulator
MHDGPSQAEAAIADDRRRPLNKLLVRRPARNGGQNGALPAPAGHAAAGFLLLDPSLRLIFANEEVVQILNYQNSKPKQNGHRLPDGLLRDKIYPMLRTDGPSAQFRPAIEFQSGRRRYVCRIFCVTTRPGLGAQRHDVALLFERTSTSTFDIEKIRKTYHLTEREEETLQHLIRGLTTKEIALRMQVSPNTVKAFLRLVMIKMGSRSRAGVMSKVMEFRPWSSPRGRPDFPLD